ncbi:MAG: rod shape-determining protein MreC, partial [Patescibacteria group bacterium]
MPDEAFALRAENEKLRADIAELQNIKSQISQKPSGGIGAIVYSRYPLNFKSELLVNAGAREKISKNNAVTFGGMLIGKISEVFEETSLVQTIYDERFQLAVRIGKDGAQALLRGGSFPILDLISSTETIKTGDIVYSAGESFPYGLPIAEIKDIRVSDDKLFQDSTLKI